MSTQILFRTEPATKELAAKRAKKDGIALQKVLNTLLSAYASGDIGIDLHISTAKLLADIADSDISSDEYEIKKADYLAGKNTVSWSEVRARLIKNGSVV